MQMLMRPLAALLLALSAGAAHAQSLTGSITGTVQDEQSGALPGASVTLAGRTGERSTVTSAEGVYRFAAVDPGTYDLRAELASFQTRRRQSIVIRVGTQLTIDFTLSVAGLAESLDVVGEAPVVDTSSSSTNNALPQDLLFNVPIRPGNAATQLLNFTPGVNYGSAFGGDEDTGNALLLDGVDTRDPEGGSAWTFFNFNLVEEVQVQGLGAPAEYGSFTGVVVNTITRSGGNAFGGLFDVIYRRDSLESDNISDAVVAQNPSLAIPDKTEKFLDFTTQLSGPLIKDKLFFFVSAERFKLRQDPSGPRTVRDEVSPRFNSKLTYQPNPNDQLTFMFQADDYNVIGRPGVSALLATDEITNREDAPELVWNFQWRHLFGSKTFAEVKYTGWTGYFDLNPEVEAPGHSDFSGLNSVSQGWTAYYDRGRNQVNASISHYAEAFGNHDFKFGVEVERSRVRNRYGYVNDIFYYDYYGAPYLAYNYGYDLDGRNQRESVYAQDTWKVSDRLTLNLGARLDFVRGSPKDGDKVYDVTNLAPRLGFAFDPAGDRKTVVKGSYGQYYEGAFFLTFSGAVPGIEDFVLYDVSSGERIEIDRTPSKLYRVDPDIKHPRTDEFTLGVERALGGDVRLAVTGIWREDKNLQASVIPSARWARVGLANDLTGGTIDGYRWVNPSESESDLLLTNPDGFQYRDAGGNVLGTARAFRKYKGLMFVLDKRMRERWLARVSYVLGKSEGAVDNSGFDSFGNSSEFETPTRALVNSEGPLANDIRHELKVMASYQVPVVEAGLSVYFRSVSGGTYTPFQQFGSSTLNYITSAVGRRVLLEPRGSRQYERQNLLDLRLEKFFNVGGGDRIGLYALIENALNQDTVTGVINRYPNQAIAGIPDPVDFGAPGSITPPRQITLGARWSF